MRKPQPQQIFRLEENKLYQVITLARHADSEEEMIVYQALFGDYGVFCQRLSSFVKNVERATSPKRAGFMRDDTALVSEDHREEAVKLNMNPLVVAFLDADSTAKRLQILDELRKDVTDDMIDIMAMSVDAQIEAADDPYDRYVELREVLTTKQRYEESGRLRG